MQVNVIPNLVRNLIRNNILDPVRRTPLEKRVQDNQLADIFYDHIQILKFVNTRSEWGTLILNVKNASWRVCAFARNKNLLEY